MNQPLLVVIPYHIGDIELAKKLIEWIGDLGSCKPHSLLLCADASIPRERVLELMAIARPHFNQTRTMLVTMPTADGESKVWPPNVMFLNAARQVRENFRFDFIWLEPDAIPMYAGWLDDIAEEYGECPRRFMGSLIKQQGQPGLPPEYLNGVAVYPNDAIEVFDKIKSVADSTQAFDIGSAAAVVPKSSNTRLIHHFWGTKDMPPIFVETKAPDSPKNHVTLDFVSKEAAVFHRSKDGKLIDLLRAKRGIVRGVTSPGPKMDSASHIILEGGPDTEKGPAYPESTFPQPPAASPQSPTPPQPQNARRQQRA